MKRNIVGPRVRKLRTAAGLTHDELARLVAIRGGDLSLEALASIERGERRVKDHEVLDLAGALGVAVERLFPRHSRH